MKSGKLNIPKGDWSTGGDNSIIRLAEASGLKWEFGQNPTQKCRTEDPNVAGSNPAPRTISILEQSGIF